MTKEIKISSHCFSNPKESNNYAQLYLAEPDRKFLEKFGRLGILVNLAFKDGFDKQKSVWVKKWSQNLIDLIKNDFYNPLRTVVETEKDFENSLEKINDWLQQEKSDQPEIFEQALSGFDIDIIVIKDDNVYFSQTGEIVTNLIQDNNLIDLAEDKNKSGKFLNIVSGKLDDDCLLFFSTKNIFDYFSQEKIVQIFSLPVSKIENELKASLAEEIDKITLACLIVSNQDEIQEKSSSKQKENREKEDKEQAGEQEEQKESEPEPEKKSKKRPEKTSEKKLTGKTEERTMSEQKTENRTEKEKTSLMDMKSSKNEKIRKLKHNPPELPIMKTTRLNYSRKTMLIISLILALLFVQSIILLARQQKKNHLAQQYAQNLEELKNKEDELSLSSVYQDQEKTKNLLNEIEIILDQLPQKTEEEKENYSFFYDKYIQQMNKLYHLTSLDDLTPLIDLSEKYKDVRIGGMTNIGNDFYIFDSNNNYIYLFNIETEKLELVNQVSANVGRLEKISVMDNDNLIAIDQNQNMAAFNTIDKKLLPLKLSQEKVSQNIQDFCLYGQRLYTLEPSENQIYKHQKTIDGFGPGQAWIQEESNVTDGLAFAIDGSIYVLGRTGRMSKFYQGKKAEFNLDEIQPSLSLLNPNITSEVEKIKLFTSDELNYLYLLDGPSKRLIILDKQGNLIKQFTSPLFEDLKDFIVSRKENRVWVLAGTKIFEIQIQ